MGARLSIKLNNLLNNEQVIVDLRMVQIDMSSEPPEVQAQALVSFADPAMWHSDLKHLAFAQAQRYSFDYSVFQGEVELSCDFNFFRDVERHTYLMRSLYEAGITFEVQP